MYIYVPQYACTYVGMEYKYRVQYPDLPDSVLHRVRETQYLFVLFTLFVSNTHSDVIVADIHIQSCFTRTSNMECQCCQY